MVQSVWKALPGWVMLNRRHAQEVADLPARAGTDDLVLAWNTVHAPEEVRWRVCGCGCDMTRVE